MTKLEVKDYLIETISRLEYKVYKVINILLAAILGLIFFSIVIIIITRVFNVFTYQVTGWYLLCTYGFVYASILGTVNLMIKGDHVSILLLYEKCSYPVKFTISIINYFLIVLVNIYIFIYSLYWIDKTGEYIIVSLHMPRYPFQFSLILMSLLVVFFSILKIVCLFLGDKQALNLGYDKEGK